MAAEIISYWSGEQLGYVFNAVSAMVNNATFTTILKIVAMVGISFFFVMTVFGKEKQEDFPKYAIAVLIFFYFMVGPKENLVITDKALQTPPQVVGNVPKVLAEIASLTSKIGSSLTDAAETVFSLPDQLSFSKAGPMFAHRILQESGNLAIKDPVISSDVLSFYRECIIPDFNTGYLDIAQVVNSDNTWGMFAATNPGRYVTLHEKNNGKWQWMSGAVTCPTAYTLLTNSLNGDVLENINQLGRKLNPHLNTVMAGNMVIGQIETGYSTMLAVSASATDIIRQKIMINFMNDASMRIAAADGDMAGMQIGIAQSMAEAQMQNSYGTMRKIAEGALPKIRNTLEAIIYALFPVMIIIAIVLGHKALSAVFMYVKLAIWIQLWPMLYAIFNFFITFTDSKIYQAQVGGNALSQAQAALINAGTVSDMYIAGMLLMSIPVVAWMIASGTTYAATQVATSLMQPAQSTAASVGSNVGAGNISMGNLGMNTARADAYNMSPQMNTGTMSVMGANGMQYGFMSGGSGMNRAAMNSSFQNDNLPFNMSASFEKANSLSTSADKALTASKTEQSAYEQSFGSAMSQVYGNVTQGSYDKGWSGVKDASTRQTLSEGASAVQGLTSKLSSGLGISQSEAAKLNLGGGLQGLLGSISKQYGSDAAAKFEKGLDANDQQNINKAANFEQAVANSQSARDGIGFSNAQRQGVESNLQKAASHKQAATAALQESNSLREQASTAYKEALTGGVDLAAAGQARAAHAAMIEARSNPNFKYQTPATQASQLADMTQNNLALMQAPMNNGASSVLTGGANGIKAAHTGNVAQVAQTGNPAQYANPSIANVGAFQTAVDAGQGQVTTQGAPVEQTVTTQRQQAAAHINTGNSTLAGDPNNPNNKGVTVGGRGSPTVTSSQVGDVTKKVADGPVGRMANSIVELIPGGATARNWLTHKIFGSSHSQNEPSPSPSQTMDKKK